MATWKKLQLLNQSADGISDAARVVTVYEIDPNWTNMYVEVDQSGTASVIRVQNSADTIRWKNLFNLTDSRTLHAISTIPRYIKAYVDDVTHESHVIVTLQYQKP